jgi:hypothetical protein
MIRFKNKKTGEIIELSRIRTYVRDDGSRYNVDVTMKYDLDDYEEIREETNYSSIHCTKAPNDKM